MYKRKLVKVPFKSLIVERIVKFQKKVSRCCLEKIAVLGLDASDAT